MSDTPIMDAVDAKCDELGVMDAICYAICEGQKLELALNEANERIKRLEEWKESAMAVEREWNPNSLSKMLGGQLGESQRKVIQREVPKLLTRIKRLEEAGNQMELVLISFQIFSDFRKSDSIRASLNWTKTKEAKL